MNDPKTLLAAALDAYESHPAHGAEPQPALRDLLTDLRHIAAERGLDIDTAIDGSCDVYHEEKVQELADLAQRNGWAGWQLACALDYAKHVRRDVDLFDLIQLVIREGDDPEWIEDTVSLPPGPHLS